MDILSVVLVVFAGVVVFSTIRIVPQQSAYILERLGKFHRVLDAGLHMTIPFVDRVAYQHSLKEIVLDIPAQTGITRDNVQVTVDGVIFFRVTDPRKASYGVSYYEQAVIQLSQTTLRSEIGKIELDRTFEERDRINNAVILGVDAATEPWGVKVLRYEIKTIQPPSEVLAAMEKQMRAEREKRAQILESEGDRDSKINRAEGYKQEVIKNSEGDRQKKINEAEGQASAILAVAKATAEGLTMVAQSLNAQGGPDAARLRVAEEYVRQMSLVAQNAEMVVVPSSIADPSGFLTAAYSVFDAIRGGSPIPGTGGSAGPASGSGPSSGKPPVARN